MRTKVLLSALVIAVALAVGTPSVTTIAKAINAPALVQTEVALDVVASAWHGNVKENEGCEGWSLDISASPPEGAQWSASPGESGDWSQGNSVHWEVDFWWDNSNETDHEEGTVSKPSGCEPTSTPATPPTNTPVPPSPTPTATNTSIPPTPTPTPTVTNTTVPPAETPLPTATATPVPTDEPRSCIVTDLKGRLFYEGNHMSGNPAQGEVTNLSDNPECASTLWAHIFGSNLFPESPGWLESQVHVGTEAFDVPTGTIDAPISITVPSAGFCWYQVDLVRTSEVRVPPYYSGTDMVDYVFVQGTTCGAQPQTVVELPAVSECPLEPVLREIWNTESLEWDIPWFEYNASTNNLRFVKNLTDGALFEDDFRNPTIRRDNCAWAADVKLDDGRFEVRTYDFAMRLLGKVTDPNQNYVQPEFVQLPDDPIVVVAQSNHQLILTDQFGVLWEPLPAYGQHPHSLTFDGRFILAYSEEGTGNLAFVTDAGEVLPSPSVKCERPEWRPDGTAVYCRVGFDLMVYSFPEAKLIEVYEGYFVTALDPDNSGRGVISGTELLYVENILASPLQPEMLNPQLGWGSDWGDLQVPADLSAFETHIEALEAEAENGGPTTSVEPVCPSYAGDSVVECLVAAGMPHSFADRAQLALQLGVVSSIDDYHGTGGPNGQNIQLLELLRGS